MFQIKSLQAEHGDALFVSYGDSDAPRHLLIDGGPNGTRANLITVLERSKVNDRLRLEALVVTHYDLDHIEGIIELLNDKPDWLEIDDIWFNGYVHLHENLDRLGPKEGDSLTKLIEGKYCWNKAFGTKAIQQAAVPIELPGDMKVYVLSPDAERLTALARTWTNPLVPPATASVPGDLLGKNDPWPPGNFTTLVSKDKFKADKSVPNGSSIALLLEYQGRSLLLAADAHAKVIQSGLAHCSKQGNNIDLLKVSHHGSKANTDDQLLKALGCRRFLISTSGKGHEHPDNQLIVRLAAVAGNDAHLYFNYNVKRTKRWSETLLMNWPRLKTDYPETNDGYICISV